MGCNMVQTGQIEGEGVRGGSVREGECTWEGICLWEQELKRGIWVLLIKEQHLAVCCWARHLPLKSRELVILMKPQGPPSRRLSGAPLLKCP